MSPLRFVDVSGVGNSGKTAVVDLLAEVEGVWTPEYWFEFDFIRVPDGLLDLRHALLEDWSPVRAHAAVKAFCVCATQMGLDPKWWDLPGLLVSTSQRYDKRFKGRFTSLSREFAQSFVQTSFLAEWPYDDFRAGPLWRLVRKVMRKLGFRTALRRRVLVPDALDFDARAGRYLQDLYRTIVPAERSIAILNNGFEPFNPIPALNMIEGARQIVVTRDPRDVFVSGLNKHNVGVANKALIATDNDGLNKSFLATDDLAAFAERLRVYYAHLYRGNDPRVLQVRFEDLVLRYDETVARIFAFLDIDRRRHKAPRTRLVPETSAQNVGLWRRYSEQDAMAYITGALPETLFAA